MLQHTHANFDPVGFSAPFMLEEKLIFLDLCSYGNLGWDDQKSEADAHQWEKWLSSLPDLERLTIPRCYLAISFMTTYLLPAFSDASNYEYGAVTYLSISHSTQTQVAFIFPKSREAKEAVECTQEGADSRCDGHAPRPGVHRDTGYTLSSRGILDRLYHGTEVDR